MITNKDTDMVFFSRYLFSYKCWESIRTFLDACNVLWGLLPNTKDIWARDYMPIQISNERMVKYVYRPDYLKDDRYITDSTDVCPELHREMQFTDTVLDGGNAVKCPNAIIMTDKIFKENPSYSRIRLINEIEELFQVELVIIPWDKYEEYGHADGMVRYIDDNHVLINNYCDFDKSFRNKLLSSLSPKFEVSELHYEAKRPSKYNWAYINFLLTGDVMLIPEFGIIEDEQAYQQLGELYHVKLKPIDVRSIVAKGGALNCISWNLKSNEELMNYYLKLHKNGNR